jgi:DNA polymerase type B, organellar and viral
MLFKDAPEIDCLPELTACPQGHLYSVNGRTTPDGRLHCRLCERIAKTPEPVYRVPSPKRAKTPLMERRVIAVDTEGITFEPNTPQAPVLFGTSATEYEPLISKELSTQAMLNHLMDVASSNKDALWVWFGSRYDADMIVKDLPRDMLEVLYVKGSVSFRFPDEKHWEWRVRVVRGKWMDVSRYKPHRRFSGSRYQCGGTSIRIYDYASFFGRKFLDVADEILRQDLSDDDREVIEHGKAKRGENVWEDLPEIRHYWEREIQLIRRVFERFREVMNQAGFALKDWYGPGAMARYIMDQHKIYPHLSGAQTHVWNTKQAVDNSKFPLFVHEASKHAFAGGRFEMFRAGRILGPVYVPDINSAYPYALTMIPSLADDAGDWVYVDRPQKIERFGVYKINYTAPDYNLIEYDPQPLFYRDKNGGVSWPSQVTGWYMSPEARMVIGKPGVTISEGWVWRSKSKQPVMPYAFLQDMFETRMRLGKKNLLSLPFKLGPNSIYGKHAQTVGWNEELRTPPKAHALLIAAWVTSYCRALLWQAMMADPDNLIAVETDSLITTTHPEDLGIRLGDGLGQWGYETYDEIVYIQSGMYYAKKGGEWVVHKSRGLSATDVNVESVMSWLSSLHSGADEWAPLSVTTQPRFAGLGFALHVSSEGAPFHKHFRTWKRLPKQITIGDSGKRVHQPAYCPQCFDNIPISKQAHELAINPEIQLAARLDFSHQRKLPWEQEHPEGVALIRAVHEAEKDLVP